MGTSPLPARRLTVRCQCRCQPVVAAKLALYTAMRAQRITKVELADKLGVSEAAVRKLTNPDHRSYMSQVEKALRAVDRSLKVEVTAA